jgi:hypothetical protein
MDVGEHPYAGGLSRRQLLYRLPPTPQPRRLLVVSDAADGDLIHGGWGGPVTVLTSSGVDAALAQGEGRFDVVAMPWVLGSNASPEFRRADAAQLLCSAHRLLVPGGVVVGHVENTCTLRRLIRIRGLSEFVRAVARRDAIGSPSRCKASLLGAGFTEPECYYVQPNIESPMSLVPCEPSPARAHFLRTIRSAQGHYSSPAYALRLLVALLGLGGMQQPQLFFWATKPC